MLFSLLKEQAVSLVSSHFDVGLSLIKYYVSTTMQLFYDIIADIINIKYNISFEL